MSDRDLPVDDETPTVVLGLRSRRAPESPASAEKTDQDRIKPRRTSVQLDAAPSLPPLRGPSTKPATSTLDSLALTLTALGSIPSAFAELQREVRVLTHAVRKVDARLPPQLVSIREAASVLGCSAATVRRKLGNGELASVRLGHTIRVDLSKLVGLDGSDVAALLAEARRRATSSR